METDEDDPYRPGEDEEGDVDIAPGGEGRPSKVPVEVGNGRDLWSNVEGHLANDGKYIDGTLKRN